MKIKIRAFDKKYPTMYYNVGYTPEYVILEHDGYPDEWVFDKIENFEIMLWTGLRDSSGVDIYEGDILEIYMNIDSKAYVTVIHKNIMFYFYPNKISFISLLENGYKYNIIGNIYENPELRIE